MILRKLFRGFSFISFVSIMRGRFLVITFFSFRMLGCWNWFSIAVWFRNVICRFLVFLVYRVWMVIVCFRRFRGCSRFRRIFLKEFGSIGIGWEGG